MRAARTLRPSLVILAALLPLLAALPSPEGLHAGRPRIAAPLDRALRVPFASVFLQEGAGFFHPWDRVLEATLPGEGRVRAPRTRRELYQGLQGLAAGSWVSLRVARGRRSVLIEAPLLREPAWRSAAHCWPVLFVGLAFLAFGLTLALGSRHPIVPPLWALSWCVGTSLLCQLDLLLPEDPGVLGLGALRGRLAALSMMLLPASVLHLSMRFPVVSPWFRRPTLAVAPYAFWALPAVLAQLHLQDAAATAVLSRLTMGATFLSVGVLVVASATAARRMSPIGQARTRALLAGVAVSGAVPLACLAGVAGLPEGMHPSSSLSLLGFPVAISWAILRYRLLDPPAWLQRIQLFGLSSLAALLLTLGAVAAALSTAGKSSQPSAGEGIPAALLAILLYQSLQASFRRGVSERVLRATASDAFLEAVSRDLARAKSPVMALHRTTALVQRQLKASRVEWEFTRGSPPRELSRLSRRARGLWCEAGQPLNQMLVSKVRDEDPGTDLPEVVMCVAPRGAPPVLVAVGSRTDGLPYTDEERRMLASVLPVVTTALEAAATKVDLQARVAEKTASLQRILEDGQAVVGAARAICEAEQPTEVLAILRGFAAAQGASLFCFEEPALPEPGAVSLRVPGEPPRAVVAHGISRERAAELRPRLDTLCAFAGLAIGRLKLLAGLKREVERQAGEIAEHRSRRLHAEFVRGVAHELRKPTEEVRHRLEELCAEEPSLPAERLSRIRAASLEMSRRLDLLLFHSGIQLDRQRMDLVRVVDDAIEAVRVAFAERIFRAAHQLPRLPMLGDPSRLRSVVENLLDNAAKATRPGQEIVVRTTLEAARGRRRARVRLEVEDAGRGISPEQLGEIFEPGISFAPRGFGLGLSLCREVVQMLGGRIEVESQPGRTRFQIWLPQFQDDSGERDEDGRSHSAG